MSTNFREVLTYMLKENLGCNLWYKIFQVCCHFYTSCLLLVITSCPLFVSKCEDQTIWYIWMLYTGSYGFKVHVENATGGQVRGQVRLVIGSIYNILLTSLFLYTRTHIHTHIGILMFHHILVSGVCQLNQIYLYML